MLAVAWSIEERLPLIIYPVMAQVTFFAIIELSRLPAISNEIIDILHFPRNHDKYPMGIAIKSR